MMTKVEETMLEVKRELEKQKGYQIWLNNIKEKIKLETNGEGLEAYSVEGVELYGNIKIHPNNLFTNEIKTAVDKMYADGQNAWTDIWKKSNEVQKLYWDIATAMIRADAETVKAGATLIAAEANKIQAAAAMKNAETKKKEFDFEKGKWDEVGKTGAKTAIAKDAIQTQATALDAGIEWNAKNVIELIFDGVNTATGIFKMFK